MSEASEVSEVSEAREVREVSEVRLIEAVRSRLRTRAARRSEEPRRLTVYCIELHSLKMPQSSRRPKAFASSMQPMVGRGGSSASARIVSALRAKLQTSQSAKAQDWVLKEEAAYAALAGGAEGCHRTCRGALLDAPTRL